MDFERLINDDKFCVWHPFTQMREWTDEPDLRDRLIVGAEGFELIAADGRRCIDGFGSLWCNLHGHRVGAIDAAIRMQLDRAAHTTLLGFASPPSIELASRLVKLAPPNLTKVFFSDCGAAAVEVALKMAFQYYHNLGQCAAQVHRFAGWVPRRHDGGREPRRRGHVPQAFPPALVRDHLC